MGTMIDLSYFLLGPKSSGTFLHLQLMQKKQHYTPLLISEPPNSANFGSFFSVLA
jgi:hypothetical protein